MTTDESGGRERWQHTAAVFMRLKFATYQIGKTHFSLFEFNDQGAPSTQTRAMAPAAKPKEIPEGQSEHTRAQSCS